MYDIDLMYDIMYNLRYPPSRSFLKVINQVYDHHIQQNKDQPGKIANPARGQLNRESEHFPFPCPLSSFAS